MKKLLVYIVILGMSCWLTVAHGFSWDSDNSYRLIVELQPDKVDRKNFPVSVEVCFPKLFAEFGINDQLDRNSIEVVAYSKTDSKVIPSRIFYPAHTYSAIAYDVIAWNMQGDSLVYAIYFDTKGNGPKPRPDYFPMIGAGEPIMCRWGQFDSIFYALFSWGDLDGDGLDDLVIGGYNEIGYLYFAKNIGTKEFPAFDRPERMVSGDKFINKIYFTNERTHQSSGMGNPLLYDWDGDGDLDLYVRYNYWYTDQESFYENVGDKTHPVFELSETTHKVPEIKENWHSSTADWDNDGELEKVSSHKYSLLYHEKPDSPGVPIATLWRFITRVGVYDLDKDGDKDIIIGALDGSIFYCRNIGIIKGEPDFARPKKLMAENLPISVCGFSTPFPVDWDGDDDIDIFSGSEEGSIVYFENAGTNDRPVYMERGYLHADGQPILFPGDPREPNGEHWGYSTMTFLDWDDDGDYDLMATERMGYTNYYENVGSKTKPRLTFSGRLKLEDGTAVLPNPRVKPGFYDWNGDGLDDIIMSEKTSLALSIYYNAGAEDRLTFKKHVIMNGPDGKPVFREPYRGSGRARFVPVDWDGDGDKDLITADHVANAWPRYFENVGTATKPQFVEKDGPKVKDHHMWVAVGHATCPAPIDWDGDGRPDIILGGEDGLIRYYNRRFFEDPPKIKRVAFASRDGKMSKPNCMQFTDIDRYVEKYTVFSTDLNNAEGADKWKWNTNTAAHNYDALTLDNAQGNEKIVYDPGLKGVYSIYIALNVMKSPAAIKVKLSNETEWQPLESSVYLEEYNLTSDMAQPKNHFELVYWKDADMTGRKVEIVPEKGSRVYLDYIKFVPHSRVDLITNKVKGRTK